MLGRGRRRGARARETRRRHARRTRAVALAVDCNPRWHCFLDPAQPAAIARGGRGGAQRRVHGRPAARAHELPELRQSGEARDHVAARVRRLEGLGEAAAALGTPVDLGQRVALQRDARHPDPPDADRSRSSGCSSRGQGSRRQRTSGSPASVRSCCSARRREELGGSAWLALRRGLERGGAADGSTSSTSGGSTQLLHERRRPGTSWLRTAHDTSEGGLAVALDRVLLRRRHGRECGRAGAGRCAARARVDDPPGRAALRRDGTGRVVAATPSTPRDGPSSGRRRGGRARAKLLGRTGGDASADRGHRR